MQYEDGKPYIFKYGKCTLRVMFQNFTPKVMERFNETLAYEKLKTYKALQEPRKGEAIEH